MLNSDPESWLHIPEGGYPGKGAEWDRDPCRSVPWNRESETGWREQRGGERRQGSAGGLNPLLGRCGESSAVWGPLKARGWRERVEGAGEGEPKSAMKGKMGPGGSEGREEGMRLRVTGR